MVVPDNIFASHSWVEINIFIYAKRNTKNGVLAVSLQRIADEFGITKGKARHIMDMLYAENLLSRTISARSSHDFRTISAQGNVDCQEVAVDSRTISARSSHDFRTISAQGNANLGDLKARSHAFGEKLIPFIGQYGQAMIRQFFDYWTEANDGGSKMRFEKEKTFEVSKRLARWHKNNSDKQKPSNLPVGMNLQNSNDKDYTKGLERWNK